MVPPEGEGREGRGRVENLEGTGGHGNMLDEVLAPPSLSLSESLLG